MTDSATYHYSCFIPFHLADPAGIVFFGHVFTLFHQAFESFVMQHLGYPWENWFQNPEWIVPIKQAEAEYFMPLQVGQACRIEISISSFSTSSFSLMALFQQEELCCLVKTVHVFCNRQNQQKMPMPSLLLLNLKK